MVDLNFFLVVVVTARNDLEAGCCDQLEIAQKLQNVVHVDRPTLVEVVDLRRSSISSF